MGGSVSGMAYRQVGARDHHVPWSSRGVVFPGEVYFALDSSLWGGGMAFFDPDGESEVAGRAYLVTSGQLADVMAQEMGNTPGVLRVDAGECALGERIDLGDVRYGTLVRLDDILGFPALTFTSSKPMRPINAPSSRYLQVLASGLFEAHRWDHERVAKYLSGLRGVGTLDAVEKMLLTTP